MGIASLKQMATTEALKVGHFLVEFATPGIGHILKSAGCEFVVLDMEHSGYSYETVRNVAQYTRAAELPLIVRVPSNHYHDISRALDMGAQGVMLPMVASADEARHIVNCIKYPPKGNRGAIFAFANDNYKGGEPLAKTRAANRSCALFLQIETVEGVNNADEIAAVDGVDCLWVGHFDLSNSLGIPGQFNHPQFLDATDTVIKAARKHGKSVGRLIPTVKDCIKLYSDGFDFISYSGDVWVFQSSIASAVTEIKEGCSTLSTSRRNLQSKSPKKNKKKKKTAAKKLTTAGTN